MVRFFETTFKNLLRCCEREHWIGYDPYDGLNSRIFQRLPFRKSKYARIALTQFCKRSPINLRPALFVRRGSNPKGWGLFLSGSLRQYQRTQERRYKELSITFMNLLKACSSKEYSGYCWGYNFDWQSRAFFVPKGTPTIVNTAYIASAFLDAYEMFATEEYLHIARSACDFIIHDLNRISMGNSLSFSYTPLDRTVVHNANALGARLLARVSTFTKEKSLSDLAQAAVDCVVGHQHEDGSWDYGTLPFQKWTDNFHTGFILEALHDCILFSGRPELRSHVISGFDFYKRNLFLQDGTPKYYHNSVYPIDIHCAAQGILTFVKLRDLDAGSIDFASRIAEWSIHNLMSKKGYFYYQKHRFFMNTISYMRWGQAWMYYALSLLLAALQKTEGRREEGAGRTQTRW